MMSLKELLPWVQTPIIINAPMGGIASADLAIAVTKAGGLGQVGGVPNYDDLDKQLKKVEESLERHNDLLPIGLGVLSFAMKTEDTLPLLERYRPAIVWIFASNSLSDYARWALAIRKSLPKSQVWIQVGSVNGALTIAKETKPDVICLQGTDAGGHGFENGAGIISLVPEVVDAFKEAGIQTPLVAAGGIADGRGAAAAFALGAQGVVLGTRFLSATETRVHAKYRAAIIGARDGGQSTVRSTVFDELAGPNQWPRGDQNPYDGRSLRTASYQDLTDGVGIEEIRRRHADAQKTEDKGYAVDGSQGRAATWASTAVGLVRKEQSAAAIVAEVREGVLATVDAMKSRL